MRDAVHAHQATAAGRVGVAHVRVENGCPVTAALHKPVGSDQGSIGTPSPRRATVRNAACAAANHRPAQIGHRSLVTVRADLAHPQHRTSAPRCSLDTARALRTARRLKTRRCAADRGERRSCRHCDSTRVRMAARSHHPCDLAEHQKQGGPQSLTRARVRLWWHK